MSLPKTQYAVQLVGPGKLALNREKAVAAPGPHQILAKVECVGLCFSDLKLLKQFDQHPRKSEVVKGLSAQELAEIPSYVPGGKPTVPGHEVTCRIVAVGHAVKQHRVGERVLVQTDYRDLPTAGSASAFGYNFEGALQEYVLMDERVVVDKKGERFLIPVPEDRSASAVALVEPWACVEDSYATFERQTVKAGGKMLLVAAPGHQMVGMEKALAGGKPASLTAVVAEAQQQAALQKLGVAHFECRIADFAAVNSTYPLPDEGFDDIVYFGADQATIEVLNDKLATRGIMNVVLGGLRIGAPVKVGVGRVHYGLTRWIGTPGNDASESYSRIPLTGELRAGDRMLVIGAGGPMGQMHVIRAVCAGLKDLKVTGTDMDDARISALMQKVEPLAQANQVAVRMVNTGKEKLAERFSYFAIMAPVGALVAQAVQDALPGALINIFAGIPAGTKHELDLDTYLSRGCYMFGTSGSTIRDMKIVLEKVKSGRLDTNVSVDAVSGMAGAAEGIAAVENRTLAGKIIVYPQLHELGLTPLAELPRKYPTVAAKLEGGKWCKAAEAELLRVGQ